MKHSNFILSLLITGNLFFGRSGYSELSQFEISPVNPVGEQGTISFILETDQTYSNGYSDEVFSQTLLELPGLGKCILEKTYDSVYLYFEWEKPGTHKYFFILLTDLPGPQKYVVQFTWDGTRGLSDGYFNGVLFRTENTYYYEPWEVDGKATCFNIPDGPNKVTDVKIYSVFLTKGELERLVPVELYGKMADLLGFQNLPSPIDVPNRKGKHLYSSKLNNETNVKGWVLEGPADINFENNYMIMRSQIPNPTDGSTGHFNFWCPEDFPDTIIIEWEFKPIHEQGCCHLFFAAKGKNDEDIFDPVLPERDGHYRQYHSGEIVNYYVIYFSNRRVLRTSNMATSRFFKSNKATFLTLGQPAVTPGGDQFRKIQLVKNGGHIQLLTDGRVCLDYTDPGSDRWGPVYKDGKIGFRQMAVSVGAYRNFNVWELR